MTTSDQVRAMVQGREERRSGHSKLVYNKETRTIDTVDPHPQGREELRGGEQSRARKIAGCAGDIDTCGDHESLESFAAEQIRQAEQAAREKALEECAEVALVCSLPKKLFESSPRDIAARTRASIEMAIRALKDKP